MVLQEQLETMWKLNRQENRKVNRKKRIMSKTGFLMPWIYQAFMERCVCGNQLLISYKT